QLAPVGETKVDLLRGSVGVLEGDRQLVVALFRGSQQPDRGVLTGRYIQSLAVQGDVVGSGQARREQQRYVLKEEHFRSGGRPLCHERRAEGAGAGVEVALRRVAAVGEGVVVEQRAQVETVEAVLVERELHRYGFGLSGAG